MKKKCTQLLVVSMLSVMMMLIGLPNTASSTQLWTDEEVEYGDFLFNVLMDIQDGFEIFRLVMDTGDATATLEAMAMLQISLNPLIPYVYNSSPISPRFVRINSYLEQAIIYSQNATISLNAAYRHPQERFMVEWGRNFEAFADNFMYARDEIRRLLADFAKTEEITPEVAVIPEIQTPVSEEVRITINGVLKSFEVPPQIINDRTMLPLRAIGEALGMTVGFDESINTAILTAQGMNITHVIRTAEISINGVTQAFDVASVIYGGRTLMPVRMLAEAVGADVEWEEVTRTVIITTMNGNVVAQHNLTLLPSPFVGYAENQSVPDFGRMFGVTPTESRITGEVAMFEYSGDHGVTIESIESYIDLLESKGRTIIPVDQNDLGLSQQSQHTVTVPGHDPFHIPPHLRTGTRSTLVLGFLAVQFGASDEVEDVIFVGIFEGQSLAIAFDIR